MSQRDVIKVRVHDGIMGLIYLVAIVLAEQVGLSGLYVAGGVAALQMASPFIKICPMHTILNKIMSDAEPIQNETA